MKEDSGKTVIEQVIKSITHHGLSGSDIDFSTRDIYEHQAVEILDAFEKSEKWIHFIQGADQDTALDLSAWMNDIHKLETAKKHFLNFNNPYAGACDDCPYPIEIRTLEGNCGRCAAGTLKFWISELGGLLGVDSKCPACGAVTLESPCPFCTNDVCMPSGGLRSNV